MVSQYGWGILSVKYVGLPLLRGRKLKQARSFLAQVDIAALAGLPLLIGRKLKPSIETATGTAGSYGVRPRLCREKRAMELWDTPQVC